MSRTALCVAGWMGSLFLAGYLGTRIGRPARGAPPAPGAGSAPSGQEGVRTIVPLVLPVESAAPAAQVDYAELRRLVREELDRSASGPWTATPPGSARPAPATPEPPTPEQQASLREATAVVDRAVAARRWTADDRRAWWDLTHRRPSLELFELQRKLMVAMNRGEIAPERGVPPFSPPTPPFPNR